MIDYIIPSLFIISIGVFSACMIYKAIFGDSRFETGFLIFSAVTFLFAIAFPNFVHIHHHCNCKAELEGEASKVAAAIASYFSEPHRTQIPSISDLVNSGDYVLLENRDSKYKKLVEESEFSIAIVDGDVNEIPIVVSSKEGRCPFQKGECSWSKGEVFVLKMGSNHNGVWLSSY
jgi:hypothetical protein